MNITERIDNYSDLERYDEDNNDMQRVLLLDEAQSEAIVEAQDERIYGGYSELIEDGFHCKDIEDDVEREKIEEEMNKIFIRIASEKIEEFFLDIKDYEEDGGGEN